MSQPSPETDLLRAAQAGDRGALEALLERHQDQIYRFGMAMCRDPESAKEVLQDTLLTVARSLGDFRGDAALSTWLYRIAHSACSKQRRRSKFAPAREHSLDREAAAEVARVADPARDPEQALAGKELEMALADAIAALDPKYREVLVLRDIEGLAAAEVAEILGLRIEAVKSRLHRARLAVRASLAPILEPAPAPAPATATSTCPDILSLFSQRLDDEISAEVCREMEQHLAGCARCRGTCDSLKQTLALCRTTPTATVPAAVQRSVRVALRDFLGTRS
jgi:RNA polymerase sigma-70 factor (ECF subfamily)